MKESSGDRGHGRTLPGTIVASHRRHFAVRTDDGATINCVLKGRSLVLACGDRVEIAPTEGGGVIEDAHPRSSLFYRSDAFKEKLIAANVTQVLGVVAPDLSLDEELVNRWIIAAEAERCRFVLIANKSDKPGFDSLVRRLEPYAALGYAVVQLSARRDIYAAGAMARPPPQRARRPIGDGQVDDPERARSRGGCAHRRDLGSAFRRPPHDVALDAARAASRRPKAGSSTRRG